MTVTEEPAARASLSVDPLPARVAHVLCVDDEAQVLRVMTRCLDSWGYQSAAAASVAEARERLEAEQYVLVLCDVNMPGESGIELLRSLATQRPEVATVMVTGQDDPGLAEMALDLGAYGYVIKPFAPNELRISVANALRRRSLELESLAYRDLLELTVRQRTSALKQAVASLEEAQAQLRLTNDEMIVRLSLALESRDANTGDHTERVSRYAVMIARQLGLDDDALRHDSHGKPVARCRQDRGAGRDPAQARQADPARAQRRWRRTPRPATASWPALGARVLDLAATIALTHHERFDGEGYPRGLAGLEIPLEGRIVAVADVFDALTSDRPYRRRLLLDDAIALIRSGRGSQFDPEVVDTFVHSRELRTGGTPPD